MLDTDSMRFPIGYWVISIAYLGLVISYGMVLPIFEAPDERKHYFTAQWIADNGELPYVPKSDAEALETGLLRDWIGQEAAQPPAYYLLASVLIARLDTNQEKAQALTERNTFTRRGDGRYSQNLNAFVHPPSEAFPWEGHVLGVHLLRLISGLIGWGTVTLIFESGRLLWPGNRLRPLLAMGFVAFLPQFLAQHAAVSNDVLIIFWVTIALFQLLAADFFIDEHSRWRQVRAVVLIGGLVGLAVLSKNQGLILAIFVIGSILIRGFGYRPSRHVVIDAGIVALLTLVFGGWLWRRNWLLYGDITATNQFILFAGGDRHYSLWQVAQEFPSIWFSLIAVFGQFNVLPPRWIYWVWTAMILIGCGTGLVFYFRDNRLPTSIPAAWARFRTWPILLFGWGLAVVLGHIYFLTQTVAAQGRLLFPALLPFTLLISFGWAKLIERFDLKKPPFGWGLLAAAVGLNGYLLLGVIRPAYTPASFIKEEDLPASVVRVDHDLGRGMQLVGFTLPDAKTALGEVVPMTLYWRRIGDTGPDRPEIAIDLFGRDFVPVGKLQTFNGEGLLPADLWPIDGRIMPEEIEVFTYDDEPLFDQVPVQARVWVKVVGEPNHIDIGIVQIVPPEWPAFEGDEIASFGDRFSLVGVDGLPERARPGETLTIELSWSVHQPVNQRLRSFVHFGPAEGGLIAQGDDDPIDGWYPTELWEPGEQLIDRYEIVIPEDAPPGPMLIRFGMVDLDSETLARVPVAVDGERQPDDALVLGQVLLEVGD